MIGRAISPKDRDIFKELRKYYPKDRINLDLDVMSEPCIFYRFYGQWEPVYKLSATGLYERTRWYYVVQAHKAIQSYLKARWDDLRKNKIDHKKEAQEYKDMKKQQEIFQKKGIRDDLPKE